MSCESVSGDTEDEYFENGLQVVMSWVIWVESGLTSKTVTIRDQYGVLIQGTRLGRG